LNGVKLSENAGITVLAKLINFGVHPNLEVYGGGIVSIKLRIREMDLGVMPQEMLDQMGYKFGRFVGNTNVNSSRVYFGVGTRF
jgi:hypothetical protein